MKKKITIFFITLLGFFINIYSQESQSDIISLASKKVIQIDDALSVNDLQKFRILQNELLSLANQVKDLETRFVIFDISINKYLAAKYYKEALNLCLEVVQKAKACFGERHKEVANFLQLLSLCYTENGKIRDAINLGELSVSMYEYLNLINDEQYIMTVCLLTSYYNSNQQYHKAIKLLNNTLSLINSNNISVSNIKRIYRFLGLNYSAIGNYPMAISYTEKALNYYDVKTYDYIELKIFIAQLYSYNNHHDYAIQKINEVFTLIAPLNDKRLLAQALIQKSMIFVKTDDFDNKMTALTCAQQSTEIYESLHDTLSNEYLMSLQTLASIYQDLELSKKANEIYKKLYIYYKQRQIQSVQDLNNLAHCAFMSNNINDALFYYKMITEQIILENGKNNYNYADVLYKMADIYYLLHDNQKAFELLQEAFPITRKTIAHSFFLLEDKERNLFWNELNYIFYNRIPQLLYKTRESDIIIMMYDALLFGKNLLLNTEILMRNFDRKGSKDNLENLLDIRWKDIQQKLNNDDIAIEIIRFNLFDEFPIYMALCIRKEYKNPKACILFSEEELMKVSDTNYFIINDMTDLVWKPFFSELNGIKNIYFSSSGVLHNIGIEYLPGMEEFNMYRLSSTRELALSHERINSDNTVLYGGLDYDAMLNSTNIEVQRETIDSLFNLHIADRAIVRGINVRGGQDFLPNSKMEVENIGMEMKKGNRNYTIMTGSEGTEESFKMLSGKKVRNLHISTHGFYYAENEAQSLANMRFIQLGDNTPKYVEDKALTRSGLLLSGANHILEGDTLPDNVEDGILTAKEIADMDLRSLDLVVLSACQTGLGDISQGEGVFGLQRGFKKAGANSILMSLWKVDDEATQIFMTQFYKNYLSGQSKHYALKSAQQYLREYDNGRYNEPKYWAAFILLDGIEKTN